MAISSEKLMTIRDFPRAQADFAHIPEAAKHDLAWFRKNPDCLYRIRKPLPDEYRAVEIPGPHRWFTLAHLEIEQNPALYVSNDGVTGRPAHFIHIGHIPFTCQPAGQGGDFLAQVMAGQTSAKNQAILAYFWADGLVQMGITRNTGGDNQ